MNQQEEHKKEHLIAVEDVMRQVRLLAGWGQYPEFIDDPGKVFNKYYEWEIEQLHEEFERLGSLCCQYATMLHPPKKECNINRILRDDEQDIED